MVRNVTFSTAERSTDKAQETNAHQLRCRVESSTSHCTDTKYLQTYYFLCNLCYLLKIILRFYRAA